jgi:hypothetical protein
MFAPITTVLKESIVVPPCHLGGVVGCVSTRLWQMFCGVSCPVIGIGLEITRVTIKSLVLDADTGDCLAGVVFTLKHIMPKTGDLVKKPVELDTRTSPREHMVEFEDSDEKIVISFEKGKGTDYEVTLCEYFDVNHGLHLDPSIRFVCIAKPVA